MKLARPLTPVCIVTGLSLALIGIYAGLFLTPPDYLQGESVRIMYVHVPAAWLGMAGYGFVAAASASCLVCRHPLAAVASRTAAPVGAVYAACFLISGTSWVRPSRDPRWEGERKS